MTTYRHFEFGKNWESFSNLIDDQRISQAVSHVEGLTGPLKGLRFLDIGCGSGLSSLAALCSGAKEVVALDVDADCVETTRRMFQGTGFSNSTVEKRSVFDLSPQTYGDFDVVYSWGVLHHTGAMLQGIAQAASVVRPGGVLAIAIYSRTRLCWAWKWEKALYSRCPRLLQKPIAAIFGLALLVNLRLRGRSPQQFLSDYPKMRGMDFWHDIHDWLGGYPYESASPEDILRLVEPLGFKVERSRVFPLSWGLFGSGCNEFSFRRIE